MTTVSWRAKRSRTATADCSLSGPDLWPRLPWGAPAQTKSEPGTPGTVLPLSVASAIRRRGVCTGAATLSEESTLRATWYRNLSWCSDRVGERLSGSLQPTPMEIQRNRSLDKGERSCLGTNPSLHDLHGFQHEARQSSMPDVSGRLQLHSPIDGDSWPASRKASSVAVAVW